MSINELQDALSAANAEVERLKALSKCVSCNGVSETSCLECGQKFCRECALAHFTENVHGRRVYCDKLSTANDYISVLSDLNNALLENSKALAVFASAYYDHPKRNPKDKLNTVLEAHNKLMEQL